MKTWIITLPFLCMVGVAMAQGADPEAAAAPGEVQAQEAAQAQDDMQVQAQDKAQAPEQAAKLKAKRRQGRDVRHCLDQKTDKAIIRCAESGRKP